MKVKEFDKIQTQKSLGDVLRHQINCKRYEKDLEIVNKFKEEANENAVLDQMNKDHKTHEVNKKVHQRNELRMEIARVLEIKRQQKLRRQEDEFKYYL